MAYFSGEFRLKSFLQASSRQTVQRYPLQRAKTVIIVFLLGTILIVSSLCYPAYLRIQQLQKEKGYWESIIKADAAEPPSLIPTMDQLPDLIDQCCAMFVKEGITVTAFNVERFGERRAAGKDNGLDYSLVRLHLHGQWTGIVAALKMLEETSPMRHIQVQETVLETEGGEALLKIYFSR
jgi:hypothetical protein